jgi:hypothetical protein
MSSSRIPVLCGKSKRDAAVWLGRMHAKDLLFCLDDKPSDISLIATGAPMFSPSESEEVSATVATLFAEHGDLLHEMAAGIVSKTFHTPLERHALKSARG